jgi:hypothetical protein
MEIFRHATKSGSGTSYFSPNPLWYYHTHHADKYQRTREDEKKLVKVVLKAGGHSNPIAANIPNTTAKLTTGIAQLSSAHLIKPTSPQAHSVMVATPAPTKPTHKGVENVHAIAQQTNIIATEPQSPLTA